MAGKSKKFQKILDFCAFLRSFSPLLVVLNEEIAVFLSLVGIYFVNFQRQSG